MHIMTKDGWKPLAIKSIPAPRDKNLIEGFSWYRPGITADDMAAAYIKRVDTYLEEMRQLRIAFGLIKE